MRPFIICHMMVSVDGKIIEDHWTPPFDGTDEDEAGSSYYDLREGFAWDAEMLGRVTVHKHHAPREFVDLNPVPAAHPQPFIGKRETERLCVVVDPLGRIKYDSDRICDENIVAVVGKQVSQAYLEFLQAHDISYVFAGEDGHDLSAAMDSLGSLFGLKRIVLEGGGIINGAFLAQGLIDELSVMIYPGVDGRKGVSSLFDGQEKDGKMPAEGQTLELLEAKNVGYGVVALRYKIHH